jgi:hypothetical protein
MLLIASKVLVDGIMELFKRLFSLHRIKKWQKLLLKYTIKKETRAIKTESITDSQIKLKKLI